MSDEGQIMTNDAAVSLQDEQQSLMARIYEEPNTAVVMEALDRLYSQAPASFAAPTYATTFGTGTE